MGTLITRTNIESAAYDNIYEIMNNRSNIRDPRDKSNTGSGGRQFILTDVANEKAFDVSMMPYIILEFPTVSYPDKNTDSADTTHKEVEWTHRIIVRVSKTGSNNINTNIGKTDYFNICDDIHKTFNSRSIKDSLRLLNQHKIRIEKMSQTNDVVDNNLIYEAEFQLSYKVRLQTSE